MGKYEGSHISKSKVVALRKPKPANVSVLDAEDWTDQKIDLLKRTICKGATDDEFQLFLSICRRTKLDPFAKQIYAVKRWDTTENRFIMQAQTSIDGHRLIAERTGKYDGQDGPYWCGEDGKWMEVWLPNCAPSAAKVTVFKTGSEKGYTGIAHFCEYVQKTKEGHLVSMWSNMPANQLAKCAESQALRKGFPNELSGLYTVDEWPADNLPKLPVSPERVVVEDIDKQFAEPAVPEAPPPVPLTGKAGEMFDALVERACPHCGRQMADSLKNKNDLHCYKRKGGCGLTVPKGP